MKKLCLLSLLVATSVNAHGHWPQEQKGYAASTSYQVTFELKNAYSEDTCFDVEINDQIITPYRTCLKPTKSKEMRIWVSSPADEKVTNTVCTIADGNSKLNMRTRMCTVATSYYPKSLLEQ